MGVGVIIWHNWDILFNTGEYDKLQQAKHTNALYVSIVGCRRGGGWFRRRFVVGKGCVVSGGSPMIALGPVFYVFYFSGEMSVAAYINLSFSSILYVAENGTNLMESSDNEVTWFLHDLNRRHVFTTTTTTLNHRRNKI